MKMPELRNRINKDELKVRLAQEKIERVTFSFYKYVKIENPKELRDNLFIQWTNLNCFGRIYVAHEGINAQMNLPKSNWDDFVSQIHSDERFNNIPFKIAVDGNGKSFYKLVIKVKEKVVADGITDSSFDASNTGTYLNAEGFNKAIEDPNTIVVDMRNHYEYEVGHFENAIEIPSDTFREQLPMAASMLENEKDKNNIHFFNINKF
jgi:UPF0176 protein